MEILIKEMESVSQKTDLLIFGFETFPEKNVHTVPEKCAINGFGELTESFDLLFVNHLLNSPCNKLFRRSVIRENHLTFPVDMSMGEDLIFNLAYIRCVERILLIPEVLYDYRRNNVNSLSSSFRTDIVEIQYQLKKEIDESFANNEDVQYQTDRMFADAFIGGIKEVSYQDGLTWSEKKILIDAWVSNCDYLAVYFRSDPARRGAFMDYLIRTKKIDLMISLYKIRKFLASVIHFLKRSQNL